MLRQAVAARPAQPLAFLQLAEILGDEGTFDEAEALLAEGLRLAPDAIILRVGLGYLALKRGAPGRAKAEFAAVRAAAPDRFDAMVGLSRALAALGEHADAASLCREALRLRPTDGTLRIALARSLLEQGERSAAEAELRAAVAADARRLGSALEALAGAPHGRMFLSPSAAARFLGARP